MEHEVYVPFTVGAVRAALAEPERVARCVPGLQPEPSEPEASDAVPGGTGDGAVVRGRLRVRIGGSSITYRGSLRLTHGEDGGGDGDDACTVRGEGAEARGDGSVELTLTIVPRPADDGEGTVLVCTGRLRGEGRITEFEEKQRSAAGRRLLDRFGGELAAGMAADPVSPVDAAGTVAAPGGIGEPDDNEPVIPGIPAPETPDSADARNSGNARNSGSAGSAGSAEETGGPEEPGAPDAPEVSDEGARPRGVFDVEVPPSSLDPSGDDGFVDEALGEEALDGGGLTGGLGDALDGGLGDDLVDELDEESRSAAEAAHARRTMIGRSAEEVDHAPPRGRYAPVPPPEESSPAVAVLRWAAPAAALAVASAVVVGRVLRRRR
ncbi:hypothetical protein [Streptomyces radiopugnans]|uniref:Carbon monoxide dehydrogenase subunit G n=1 Tax=Streptomyces radiopugnans TaxID=403935 RepID=A0A1H9JZ61_9ACTN|nr:hypothetical protein [Streptomyces radiopugnans]SEQ92094.1 Carbon monoxide dehydrogenase subunit G [Streptomyces radiopugnans]